MLSLFLLVQTIIATASIFFAACVSPSWAMRVWLLWCAVAFGLLLKFSFYWVCWVPLLTATAAYLWFGVHWYPKTRWMLKLPRKRSVSVVDQMGRIDAPGFRRPGNENLPLAPGTLQGPSAGPTECPDVSKGSSHWPKDHPN